MNADRFTIDTDGGIFIQHPFAANMTVPQMFEGAIRQQARDIKLLTQMLHDQRLVIDDLEHRRVKVCDENDQLRTDLAAAVALTAARDETIAELELRLRISRQSNKVLRESAEQAEARLAAIDAAPTVASVGHGDYLHRHTANVPVGTFLIARPAKD